MVKCPRCGLANRSTSRYCKRCGTRISVHLEPGETLKGGTIKILRRLGKGGMGSVYLATQTLAGTQRNVVVKHLIPYWDENEPDGEAKARQRFEREAATLVELNHPGVPQIYDYFSENGQNYIVMQLIEGEALDERLTREDEHGNLIPGRPYPADQVISWGKQLCEVLEYLSTRQPPVLHHDIKPANIIIDNKTGAGRLVDFGTAQARLVAQAGGKVGIQKSSIYGTEGYAAPEMYKARSSPKSDVYSLASTLYHLLTDDDPRTHPFNFPKLSEIDQRLRQVLERALEPDATRRPTAQQFRQALEALLPDQGHRGLVKIALADLYGKSNQATKRPIGKPVRQFRTTDPQVVLCLRLENLDSSVPHTHEVVALFHTPEGYVISRKPKSPVQFHKGTQAVDVDVFGFRISGTNKEQQSGQWKATVLVDNRVEAEIPFEIVAPSPRPPPKYQPTIAVQPAALDFQLGAGYKLPAQTLSIRCSGSMVSGRIHTNTPWIRLSHHAFSGDTSLSVTIDIAKIVGPGRQQGEVRIEAATQVIVVPVRVQGTHTQVAPRLAVQPPLVQIDQVITGRSQEISVRVFNAGGGTLRGRVTTNVPWLKPLVSEFTNTADIAIALDSSMLKPGMAYRGIIEINAEEEQMRQIPVFVSQVVSTPKTLPKTPPLTRRQSFMLAGGFALVIAGILLFFLSLLFLLIWPQSPGGPRLLMGLALLIEGVGLVWNLCLWRSTRHHKLAGVILIFNVAYLLFLAAAWRFVMR